MSERAGPTPTHAAQGMTEQAPTPQECAAVYLEELHLHRAAKRLGMGSNTLSKRLTEAGVAHDAASVRALRRARGLASGRGSLWSPEDDAELRRMAQQGMTMPAIAEAMGRTEQSVKNRAHLHGGITALRDEVLGVHHTKSRMTRAMRARVLAAVRQGQRYREIAQREGCSLSMIGTIRREARLMDTPPDLAELRDMLSRYKLKVVTDHYRCSAWLLHYWLTGEQR